MQTKIKIALLAPYNVYPPRTGGKKFIAFFHQYLSKLLPVEFISVKENSMPRGEETHFHPLLGSSKLRYGNLFLFFRLRKFIRRESITDIVMVHPYFGWLARMLKSSTGIKLSLLSHNIESVRFRSMGKWWWRLLWQYEKHVHRHIDNNFFVTEEDRQFAIKHYGISPHRCHVITYGTELKQPPSDAARAAAGKLLREQLHIDPETKILLFNGTLDYLPNIEAIDYILKEINPLLQKNLSFKYQIVICGKGLPVRFSELKNETNENILYTGFVPDIDLYFKGADIFLNPVITGGGIKTKLVEALAFGLSSVSTASGGFGVPQDLVPRKLQLVSDGDWQGFAEAIFSSDEKVETPARFFNHFYWGNIAAKAAAVISAAHGL